MKNLFNAGLLLGAILLFMTSCDDGETLEYNIPESYDGFENVSYSGQTQRLGMLTEMTTYMKTANTAGTTLDADKLKAMYTNDVVNAGFVGTYDDSKQLKSKTLEAVQGDFEVFMDKIAEASQSTLAATLNQAGIAVSLDLTASYLLNDKGVEYTQIIEKGLMGACFYYQATTVYFGFDKMNVDNETITAGEGTEMEHHWDEAFGYLGASKGFPVSTDGLAFWAKYSNIVNGTLYTNQLLMTALLQGRAAITNKDLEARDQAIMEARAAWELIVAGTAIHYFNGALENENDFAIRAHELSEAVAFAYSLQFNPQKSLTNSQVNEVLTKLGGSSNVTEMNFYNTTNADIQAAKDLLAGYMNWDSTVANAL
jgi:hypothetical protein